MMYHDPRLGILLIVLSILWVVFYVRFMRNCYLGKYDKETHHAHV